MGWKKVRLGEVLTESKVESTSPSVDSRIRVLLNAKGVIKRPVKKETKGATKYFIRKKGQFIYGKQNIHKGAFGVVPDELNGFESTSDLPAFDIGDSCLPEWLDYYFKQGNFYLSLINIARGAATKRVQPKELLELKIPLPDIKEQRKIVAHFKSIETEDGELKTELTHQKNLLKKLRQQILQEAIEGKLSTDWRKQSPDVEPASELLKRIQAEKAQLIKDKKIRKQKPLPAISEEEIPFDLPEGWVWCRLGNVIDLISGQHIEASNCNKSGDGSPYITGPADFGITHPIITKWTNKPKVMAEKGDLLITVKGSGVGKTNLSDINNLCISRQLMAIRTIACNKKFIEHQAENMREHLQNSKDGLIPGITREHINFHLLSLPPLQEQKAIVTKVEKLLTLCDQLETQVTQNQNHAEQLMQAVLKEAFSQQGDSAEQANA